MLAQTGAKVLMIDCDLRRPRLHAQFELSNTKGLTTWLSGEKNLDVDSEVREGPNLKGRLVRCLRILRSCSVLRRCGTAGHSE